MLRLIFLLFSLSLEAGNTPSNPKSPREGNFLVENRPSDFSDAVEHSFHSLRSSRPPPKNLTCPYQLAYVNLDQFLKTELNKTPRNSRSYEKYRFTVLELSDVYTGWGKSIFEKIRENTLSVNQNIYVQIISANQATNELDILQTQGGVCEYRTINKTSFDDLRKSLHETSSVDLLNECDLIIAGDVLKTAVDPLNLFCEIHSLLKPGVGVLFSKGFTICDETVMQHVNKENFYDHADNNLKAFLSSTGEEFLLLGEKTEDKHYKSLGDFIYWRKGNTQLIFPNFYGQALLERKVRPICTYDLLKIAHFPALGKHDYQEERGPFDFWGTEVFFKQFASRVPEWREKKLRLYVRTIEGDKIIVREAQLTT